MNPKWRDTYFLPAIYWSCNLPFIGVWQWMKKNDDALNNPRVHLVSMNPATLNPFKRIAGAQSTAREYGAGVRAQFFNSHRSAGLQARGQYQCKVWNYVKLTQLTLFFDPFLFPNWVQHLQVWMNNLGAAQKIDGGKRTKIEAEIGTARVAMIQESWRRQHLKVRDISETSGGIWSLCRRTMNSYWWGQLCLLYHAYHLIKKQRGIRYDSNSPSSVPTQVVSETSWSASSASSVWWPKPALFAVPKLPHSLSSFRGHHWPNWPRQNT